MTRFYLDEMVLILVTLPGCGEMLGAETQSFDAGLHLNLL